MQRVDEAAEATDTQWSKPSKNHDKIPNNYVNLPRKSHTYRIQQPCTVIYS
jgi:hypothetical protein